MPTRRTIQGPSGLLRESLTNCASAGVSGVLQVTGAPGGTIHLAEGTVAAIQTPGAPSPEVILLRSHQVTEAKWDAAFAAAAAAGGPMCAELVKRSILGFGELEALLRTALADAMFVLASGSVEECQVDPGSVDYLLPLEPGAEAELLLAEAARRMKVLAALPSGTERGRVVAVPGAVRRGAVLGQGRDEILALANGRRSPRDMAFALGRGVYATTLQLAQMREAGILATASASGVSVQETALLAQTTVADKPETAAGLPHRRKGRSALPRRTTEPRAAAEQPAPHRLLRPRSGRNSNSGDTA
jgi:hypothetical protein